jgi:hypothetical protein
MRFLIEYSEANTKSHCETIALLNSFLNHHLIEKFHGWSYECFIITLIAHAPARKKWKLKRIYDQWADIELPIDSNLKPVGKFAKAFEQVKQAVDLAKTLPIKGIADFRFEQLIEDLTALQKLIPTTEAQYKTLLGDKATMDSQFQVRRVDGYIHACRNHPLPHSSRLLYTRVYDQFDNEELLPYRYMYPEILGTLLRNANISTPGYKEIYFSVGRTIEESKGELGAEKWHKYTYCAIDIEVYRKSSPGQKEQLLLDSLISGLRLIADFDHLDKQKIEAVIEKVSKTKSRTPLSYAHKENKTHRIHIHYEISADHTQKSPVYITITNKQTGKEVTRLIDNLSLFWLPYYIGKIKLSKGRVEILGRGGERGHVARDMDDVPDRYEFDLTVV